MNQVAVISEDLYFSGSQIIFLERAWVPVVLLFSLLLIVDLYFLHTSSKMCGQIYIPKVNWTLLLLCLAVTIGFKDMSSHKDTYALKAVTDLPVPFRSTFSFRYSNSLLSECFPTCYFSDVNMVISAPTGSGKTVLFELCIMRLLSKFIDGVGKFSHHKGTLKTIYIVPPKALVHEKVRDWIQKLGPLGINCLELTGDNEHYSITNIQDADIILTTPEKLDGVTRSRIKGGGLGSTYSVGEEVCHGSLSNLCVPRFSNQPSLENGTDYLPASDEPQNEAKNPPLLRGENSRGTEPEAVHNCGSISNALLPCLACDECLEAKKRAQENSVLSMAKPIIQRPIAGSEVMSSPCVWQR